MVKCLEEPRFYDHSYLHFLNLRAIARIGLGPLMHLTLLCPQERTMEKCSCQNILSSKRRETRQLVLSRKQNCAIAAASIVKPVCHPNQQNMDCQRQEQQANNAVEESREQEQEPEQHRRHSVDQHSDNPTATALGLPSAAYLFHSTAFGMVPPDCCFSWQPFCCRKKLACCNCKCHCGEERQGRPVKCNLTAKDKYKKDTKRPLQCVTSCSIDTNISAAP